MPVFSRICLWNSKLQNLHDSHKHPFSAVSRPLLLCCGPSLRIFFLFSFPRARSKATQEQPRGHRKTLHEPSASAQLWWHCHSKFIVQIKSHDLLTQEAETHKAHRVRPIYAKGSLQIQQKNAESSWHPYHTVTKPATALSA